MVKDKEKEKEKAKKGMKGKLIAILKGKLKAGYKPTAPESMKRKMIAINPSSWIRPMDKDKSRFFKDEFNKTKEDLYK